MRLRLFISGIIGIIVTIGAAAAFSSAAPPPVPIDPLTIPKYTDQLVIPPAYLPTVVTAPDGKVTHEYTVSMEQFQQQLLPAGYPMTSVFGYKGMIDTPGGPVPFQNTPSATFEATRGIPVKVHWVNNLTSQILPVDPTIMWADPNAMGMPTPPFNTWPPGYSQAQSPVPAVPHLHGGEMRSDSDGGPEAWITSTDQTGPAVNPASHTAPNTLTDNYPNAQQPTTLWYHDHALGLTRINVFSGLAGFYMLRDPADPVAGSLPSGQYEIPIAIQDRSFMSDGSFNFDSAGVNPDVHPYWVPEFFGDTIMVNGKLWPNLNVEPRQYRIRILNGSNARFYHLALDNGQSFTQIGSEGGYLPAPVTMSSLTIAPGERDDVLIDFSGVAPGTQIIMTNDAPAPYPAGTAPDPNTTGQIMRFTVGTSPAVAPAALPATLNTIPALTPDAPKQTGVLIEVMSAIGAPLQVLLNGQPFSAPVSEKPTVGSTEQWEIVNLTGDTHPMHFHLVQFQVVDRQAFDAVAYEADWTALNGTPPFAGPTTPLDVTPYLLGTPVAPDANETGWKDTVKTNPGEVTRIRIRYAPQDAVGAAPNVNTYPFDPTFGPGYVWHCHIVDHEDNEMMRPLAVVQNGKPALSLRINNAYWASMADYTARRLSVSFTVSNGMNGSASNARVTAASGTGGVTNTTALPLPLGNIASAESTTFTLAYNVPNGVARFTTSIQVGANDSAGASYVYP